MLSSFRGDKHKFCLVVIKFKHVRSCPDPEILDNHSIVFVLIERSSHSLCQLPVNIICHPTACRRLHMNITVEVMQIFVNMKEIIVDLTRQFSPH